MNFIYNSIIATDIIIFVKDFKESAWHPQTSRDGISPQ